MNVYLIINLKATIIFFLQTINNFSRSFSSGSIYNFKPVVIYDNADVDKIRIITENRRKIAVYRWVNKINGNIYIGSSTNFHVRMYTYFSLRSLAKSNRPIDRALLKHGFSNFRLEILEYCILFLWRCT